MEALSTCVLAEKHQVNIGVRKQLPAAVAPQRHEADVFQVLGLRRQKFTGKVESKGVQERRSSLRGHAAVRGGAKLALDSGELLRIKIAESANWRRRHTHCGGSKIRTRGPSVPGYFPLKGSFPFLLITDTDGLIHSGKEYLAVANFPGPGRFQNGLHRALDEVLGQHHFDFYFWKQVYFVFAAAVGFRMALLPPVTAHLGNGHALDADLMQGLLHPFEARRLDDRFNPQPRLLSPCIINLGRFDLHSISPGARTRNRILLLRAATGPNLNSAFIKRLQNVLANPSRFARQR